LISAGDGNHLEPLLGFVQLHHRLRDGSHTEPAAKDEDDWLVVPQSHALTNSRRIRLAGEFL
jgi:hypothetical protein